MYKKHTIKAGKIKSMYKKPRLIIGISLPKKIKKKKRKKQ